VLARSVRVYSGSKSHEWAYFEALSKFLLDLEIYGLLLSHTRRSEVGF
jgi:hypothetical protein